MNNSSNSLANDILTAATQPAPTNQTQARLAIQRINCSNISSLQIRLEGCLDVGDNRELFRECIEAVREIWVRYKNAKLRNSLHSITTIHQGGDSMWTDVLEDDRVKWGN